MHASPGQVVNTPDKPTATNATQPNRQLSFARGYTAPGSTMVRLDPIWTRPILFISSFYTSSSNPRPRLLPHISIAAVDCGKLLTSVPQT